MYSDVTEVIELSPSEVKELPIELRRMVASFKHTKKTIGATDEAPILEETIELKFYDKMKTLEMINRHIGFYEADNEQQAPKVTTIDMSGVSQSALDEIIKAGKDATDAS